MFRRAGLTFALIVCCALCLMLVMAASAGAQTQRTSFVTHAAGAQ